MTQTILELKKLNAAYIAALEFDRVPNPKQWIRVKELHDTGVTDEQLKEVLTDEQGRRPDEIASAMSDLIKQL